MPLMAVTENFWATPETTKPDGGMMTGMYRPCTGSWTPNQPANRANVLLP